MKIYLASSFSLFEKIEKVCKSLKNEGHEILVRWWDRVHLKKKVSILEADDFYKEPECKYAFERDLQGVKDCDALIFVASDEMKLYTGASVEIGMAFALDKPVYSIGVFKNSAMYYRINRCQDIQEVISLLSLLTETE